MSKLFGVEKVHTLKQMREFLNTQFEDCPYCGVVVQKGVWCTCQEASDAMEKANKILYPKSDNPTNVPKGEVDR